MGGTDDITQKQIEYIEALAKKHKLPPHLLDQFCRDKYMRPLKAYSRRMASDIIQEMSSWEHLPDNLMRAKGQLDLFKLE